MNTQEKGEETMNQYNKEHKFTIRFPENQFLLLKHEANQMGTSLSEYIRFQLSSYGQSKIDMIALQELTSLLQILQNAMNSRVYKENLLSESLNGKHTKENQINQIQLMNAIQTSSQQEQELISSLQKGIMKLWESLN